MTDMESLDRAVEEAKLLTVEQVADQIFAGEPWTFNGMVEFLREREAAIRAPLEERIREMEDELEALKNTPGYKLAESWQRDYGVVFEENQELKSEVERLREALEG